MDLTDGVDERSLKALEAKVAFLSDPASYPHQPKSVERIETHMSWVFLTDRFVYKLKKPIRLAFLDFRSLDARRRNCETEVALNRRLAHDVYLGTVAITRSKVGTLELGGDGEAVDWLVKMRRLPSAQMLDQAIRNGTVRDSDIERVATLLATFYKGATPIEMSGADYRADFRARIDSDLEILEDPCFNLPHDIVARVTDKQRHYLESAAAVFDRRAADNRLIEAHGDLRPEHVCLGDPPHIIDCLEFKRSFRILDPVDELAFLSMECDFLGADFIQPVLFRTYRTLTGDNPPAALISFYKSYRACLRAKLSVWHLADPQITETEKWTRRGRRYLDFGARYADQLAG